MERYTDYDGFAWFYNRYWSLRYHQAAAPLLDRLLLSGLGPGARVLDLCCGPGHLSRHLAERGFRVVGLDGSAELLRYARQNVPSIRFLVADARDFILSEKFEAVLCTFDSLNHVLDWDGIVSVFERVYSVLEKGGSFLFDLNMEKAYLTMWEKMSAVVEEDNVCIVRGGYDRDKKLGCTEITTFRLLDNWQRADTTLFQRCYSLGEVVSGLRRAGFSRIESYDAEEDLGLEDDIGKGRMFFLAWR